MIVEGRAGELDSTGEDDQLNLVEGKLGDGFGRGEAFIFYDDKVGHRPGPEVPFSIAQTQNICRPRCDHLIECIGIEADLVAGKTDFVEQITGSGERRIASQDDCID